MSGGVDSSVAAHLLKQQGHDVTGLFMWKGRHANGGSGSRTCCSEEDSLDACRVADALEIPFEILNFEAEFARLIDYFCDEYNAARTPNPCIMCNLWLKFGRLQEYADKIGADYIATGHYARIEHRGGRHLLLRGVDSGKDQSYVLFCLTQDQLARAIFPNGEMTKREIRRIAADLDLPVKDKPESQEICFVPDDDYGRFLRERTPDEVRPGPVTDLDGSVVGEHPGVQFFTIGQRHGLRIPFGKPMYVVRLEPETNTVVMGPNDALMACELTVSSVNWSIEPPSEPLRVTAKIRYRHRPRPATVHPLTDGRARVVFGDPVRAITPGQAAVFYLEDVVAGGGWIE
ncbi:MAG: tRNA 2-thiouridine(34) synthase MnmA [Planctomycetes bacterium]|nr:tRNA 2-thiouridine(34) synthase MnmA [Planctomycetota bacterium]